MEKINSDKVLENIKLGIFFMYILTFYIFGSNPNTVVYSEIILMLFIALEGLSILKTKKIKYCVPILVLFLFVFYCFLSSFWAIYPEMAIIKAKTLLLLVTFLLISYNFFISIENGEKKLLKIIMYAGFIFSIYVIMYYGIGQYINMLLAGERVGQEIDNVNAIGQQTAFSVIIAIFFGLYENKKIYYLLAIAPLVVALGTGSRKVIGLLIISTILLFVLKREEKINIIKTAKRLILFVTLVIIFIWLSQLQMFSTIFERFETNIENIKNNGTIYSGTENRALFIKGGIEQFLETPILGIGIDNSSYITMRVAGWATYLHNNYLELLACTGIIGFLLYYSVYAYIIITCLNNLKYKNKYINIVLTIFLSISIEEYALVTYSSKSTYLYILLALVTISKQKKQTTKKGEMYEITTKNINKRVDTEKHNKS